jgi:hypothetical protein
LTGYQKMLRGSAPKSVPRYRLGRRASAAPQGYARRDLVLLARIGRRRALQTLNDRRFQGQVSARPTGRIPATVGA